MPDSLVVEEVSMLGNPCLLPRHLMGRCGKISAGISRII
jgi:hypothetical protein